VCYTEVDRKTIGLLRPSRLDLEAVHYLEAEVEGVDLQLQKGSRKTAATVRCPETELNAVDQKPKLLPGHSSSFGRPSLNFAPRAAAPEVVYKARNDEGGAYSSCQVTSSFEEWGRMKSLCGLVRNCCQCQNNFSSTLNCTSCCSRSGKSLSNDVPDASVDNRAGSTSYLSYNAL